MNIWNWTQTTREQKNPAAGDVTERDILVGDIVQHFKREWVSSETSEYLYKGSSICGSIRRTGEEAGRLSGDVSAVQDMCQTYDMFMSEVDREKYPKIRQKYRFEKIKL